MIGTLAALIAMAIVALVFVFWIWMLVDCIKNPSLDSTHKIIWVLVILFLHGLGGLIYYFAGRSKTA